MLNRIIIAAMAIFACVSVQAKETVKLTADNMVLIRTVIDDGSVGKATDQLLTLLSKRGDKHYPIYIVLDSPGGSISAGEDFIQFAKTIPNVKTLSLFSASMASAIVEGMPGERLMIETAVLMFHRAKGGFQGQFEDGEVESQLAFFKTYVRRMEKRNADRMGISLADYKAKVKDEYWIGAEDAVKTGAADRIVDATCSKELIDGKEEVMQTFFIFQIKLQFSKCPMLRSPTISPNQDKKLVNLYKRAIKSNAF